MGRAFLMNPSIPLEFFEKHIDKVNWRYISRNPLIPLDLFKAIQKNQIIYAYIETNEKCNSVREILSEYFPDDISYEVLKFFSYGKKSQFYDQLELTKRTKQHVSMKIFGFYQ